MFSKKQNFTKNKETQYKTAYRRTYEASPFFRFLNAEISTSGFWFIDIAEQNTKSQKWLPLTNVRIANNSSQDIAIFPNQTKEGMIIPAGTILTFDRKTVPAINSLKIQNLNTTTVISAEKLDITFWKEAVEFDQAFSEMHKAFYNFLRKK